MKKNSVISLTTLILACNILNIVNVFAAQKPQSVLNENLSSYFKGYNGCFVLLDNNRSRYTIYNKAKINQRICPCSTYKILVSLIGLETRVLKDENSKRKWNGIQYPISAWNRDQTLTSAINNSVNWYYNEVALKIGQNSLDKWVIKADYGNNDMSKKGFREESWLPLSLKVSPMEQIDFLKRFYSYNLPFKKRNIDIIKKAIILSKNKGTILSGKTGTGGSTNRMGWFIGYVEKNHNVYFYATNIDSNKNASGAKAKEISLKILKKKKLSPMQAGIY